MTQAGPAIFSADAASRTSSFSEPQARLRLASRRSMLALAQTHLAELWLSQHGFMCETIPLSSPGDDHPDTPLTELSQHYPAKASFVSTLEAALQNATADAAVHSLKDLPASDTPPLTVACYHRRQLPFDLCLIKKQCLNQAPRSIAELADAATRTPICLATSSPRRQAVLKAILPHITTQPIRGNVDTRLAKVLAAEHLHGLIIAGAGMVRLKANLTQKLAHFHSLILPPSVFIPAPGQGVIAIQMLTTHPHFAAIKALSCPETALCATLERLVVAALGAHCSVPLGCYARINHSTSPTLKLDVALFAATSSAEARLSWPFDLKVLAEPSAQQSLHTTIRTEVIRELKANGLAAVMTELGLPQP